MNYKAKPHPSAAGINSHIRNLHWFILVKLSIWNWKSAVMSAAYRAPIFFFTSLKSGWRMALGALLAETAFRAFTSGFWGAFTQAVRLMEPAWLGVFLVCIVAPVVVQSLNLLIHLASGTPNLKQGFFISCCVTGLASLFNWYAMRKGTFVTGREGGSLWHDIKQLPLIIFGFVTAVPVALWRYFRPTPQSTEASPGHRTDGA